MLDYLAQPEVIDALRAGDEQGEHDLSAVRDQLAAVRWALSCAIRARPPWLDQAWWLAARARRARSSKSRAAATVWNG